MGGEDVVARHLTVRGKVQGVFFRGWAVETARKLGLAGWVRNRMNGDVEALVQGDEEAVERFLLLAWRGPPTAKVMVVQVNRAPVTELQGFAQEETV